MHSIQVIDSHTGGEPTRVVISGGPDLGAGDLATRREYFRHHCDPFRSAIVNEPRGSDAMVGAMLCEPTRPDCVAGVIFFNNVGVLGMCGHGTIGVAVTLAHLGRIDVGRHALETPVGVVPFDYFGDNRVSLENVVSYRQAKGVTVDVPGHGPVTGDVAWSGNWFYLVQDHGQELTLSNVPRLTDLSTRMRRAVNSAGFPDVDHVELFGPPLSAQARSRNFVLCPGNAYDRSPCGTGTSAKLACLAADGKLAEGDEWIQESIVGTSFVGRFDWEDRARGRVIPTITGTAFVNAEAKLLLDERDPFQWGIRVSP